MVVDNLNDFGVFNAFNRLPAFVVVDEDNLFAFGQHDFIRADNADKFIVFDDGITAVTVLVHDALNVAEQIHRSETHGIGLHDSANGHALINQPADGVRVIRRHQNENSALFGFVQNFGINAAVLRDDEAGDCTVEELEQSFRASVADDNNVLFVEDTDCRKSTARRDNDVAFNQFVFVAADQNFRFGGLNYVAITDAHVNQTLQAEFEEISFGKVADRNDTDEIAV